MASKPPSEAINAAAAACWGRETAHLIIKDDACDPKQAVAIANELSGEGIFAVIGHMCSGLGDSGFRKSA